MNMPLVLLNRRRRGFTAFSPASLFSTTAIGIWLDPSDLSTMFSDRAGTTAVTTPGTVVGLRLDKSKGLVQGAELVGGVWSGTGNAQDGTVFSGDDLEYWATEFPTVIGRSYRFTATLSGKVNNSQIRFRAGISGTGTALYSSNNDALPLTVNILVVATSTTSNIEILFRSASASVTLSNISVRELAGNHAVAPTDAARPIYGVEPKGGRRNLLLATDTLATQSLTVTAVAHTLAFTGTGTVTLTGASTAGPLVGTGAGNRVSLTFTPTAASLTLTVSGSVTLGQLELSSSATAYQKVVTAYDVTESGVATCHYVQYDGSDDSMSTSAIDFTGTDKMSVFAGVRKLSDATTAVLVETSAAIDTNDGAFLFRAPAAAGANSYRFDSKGTITSAAGTGVFAAAPVTSVLTGLGDISGDTSTLRLNGVVAGTGTGDQGTGNFGNYPLFIGRRNNASLPFNGKDYGLIVVGKAASATEISNTETWLAARTSGVTL